MRKDVRDILDAAKAAGWRVGRRTKAGHYKCYAPGGGMVVVPGTASDSRSLANTIAEFKRLGTDVSKPARAPSRPIGDAAAKRYAQAEAKAMRQAAAAKIPTKEEEPMSTTNTTNLPGETTKTQTSEPARSSEGDDIIPTPSVRHTLMAMAMEPNRAFSHADLAVVLSYHPGTISKAMFHLIEGGLAEEAGKAKGPNDKHRAETYRITDFGADYWAEEGGQIHPTLPGETPRVPLTVPLSEVTEPEPIWRDPMLMVANWMIDLDDEADAEGETMEALLVVLRWLKTR